MQSGEQLDGLDQPTAVSAKVAEIFMSAGMAFQRLGDLTLQLHAQCDVATDENMKWSPSDMERLRSALKRFADDLCDINESVQAKTAKQIKQDIKRKSALGPDSFSDAFSSASAAATAASSAGQPHGLQHYPHHPANAPSPAPSHGGLAKMYQHSLTFPSGPGSTTPGGKKRGRPRTRVMVEPVGPAVVNQLQQQARQDTFPMPPAPVTPQPHQGRAYAAASGAHQYHEHQQASASGRQQQPPTVNMFGQHGHQTTVDGFAAGVGPALF